MKKSKLIHFLALANRNPRIGAMCLGFLACSLMSPFVFFALSDLRFIFDGVSVDARIVDLPSVVRRKFFTCYSYRFEFKDTNGQLRLGESTVRVADFRPGDKIAVRHLRSSPARSKAEIALRSSWPTQMFAMIVIVVLVASAWSGIAGIRDVLRQLR